MAKINQCFPFWITSLSAEEIAIGGTNIVNLYRSPTPLVSLMHRIARI